MTVPHVSFPGKEPDEKVLLVLRRHWFVVFKRAAAFALGAFAPGVLLLAAAYLGHPFVVDSRDIVSVAAVLALSTFELGVWVAFYMSWLDYELDVFIVTDRRVVNINQNGLFNRSISEQKLTRVQDVTAQVKGMLPTFLHFGTVFVQTAGEQEHFVFRNVANPEIVAKVILQQMDKVEEQAVIVRPGSLGTPESTSAVVTPIPGGIPVPPAKRSAPAAPPSTISRR